MPIETSMLKIVLDFDSGTVNKCESNSYVCPLGQSDMLYVTLMLSI